VSGGDRVDEGLELGRWVLVRPGLPPSVEGVGGVSQERTARKALGQQGCWGWWDGTGSSLWPLVGAGGRRGGVQGSGWGEPLVPAEGEGTVDQGLVAADGAVGANLEVGSAEFVLDLLVALLEPWPQAVEADDLGEVGRGCVRASGVWLTGRAAPVWPEYLR
jgi:hypothetical protein